MNYDINIKNYWKDIDHRLVRLINEGFCYLPPINELLDNSEYFKIIHKETRNNTYNENNQTHKNLLKKYGFYDILLPKLYNLAKKEYFYNGRIDDQYHIARRVEPGNSKEMYRAHFDSHIFTMVIPIKIPNSSSSGSSGDLIFHPNSRENPNSEIVNILSKAYHKRYASKDGLEKFGKNHTQLVDNFTDYRPLLFIGNTTLHTNKPVSLCCDSHRLTLLAHFFDSSSKYGIGSFLRLIRNR